MSENIEGASMESRDAASTEDCANTPLGDKAGLGKPETPQEDLWAKAARLAASDDFNRSFDAVVWAKAFVRIVVDGKVEIDESLMIAWFANAIMRGYDYRDAQVRAAFA